MTKKKHTLLVGAHMSIAGGFEKSIQHGESINCTAIQIFTKSNRQWHAKPITKSEQIAFQKALQNSSVSSVIAHASYLINIGSPRKQIEEKSINALLEELHRCKQLGISFLVLHPGAHLNDNIDICLERIALNLDKVLSQTPDDVTILLENTAGQGTNIGYSFEHLAIIREKSTYKERVQFCFDTCHAFSAGYDFRSQETYNTLWQTYDKILGIQNLKVIHINDSQKKLGSRIDRHEHIGRGMLGLDAFSLILNDQRFFDIPKILETPKEEDLEDDKKNMSTIKGLLTEEK